MDPLKEFQLVAFDFLKIIVYKRKNNQGKEADALENFYESMLNITTRAAEEMHLLKLRSASEHFKAVILEQELKTGYNEIFKRDQKLATELITRSSIPTKKQLEQEVVLK